MPKKCSWFECVLLAPLSCVCGMVLALVYLVAKPVLTVEQSPPPEARRTNPIYYVKGSHDVIKGSSWVQKRRLLLAATSSPIVLVEDELNTWFAASTHIKHARKSSANRDEAMITVGHLDFRIADDSLQIALPVLVDVGGTQMPLIMQLRGGFVRTASPSSDDLPLSAPNRSSNDPRPSVLVFKPDSLFIGSLPLHRVPRAMPWLLREAFSHQVIPAEAAFALGKIDHIAIVGREVHVIINAELK